MWSNTQGNSGGGGMTEQKLYDNGTSVVSFSKLTERSGSGSYSSDVTFGESQIIMMSNSNTRSCLYSSQPIDLTDYKLLKIKMNTLLTGGTYGRNRFGIIDSAPTLSIDQFTHYTAIDANTTTEEVYLDISDVTGQHYIKTLCDHTVSATMAMYIYVSEISLFY